MWPFFGPTPRACRWSQTDIAPLLDAARALTLRWRGAPNETLLGILAVSGMRVGEALHPTREDVDLHGGVLRIRDANFDRERLVPLYRGTTKRCVSTRPAGTGPDPPRRPQPSLGDTTIVDASAVRLAVTEVVTELARRLPVWGKLV